MGKNNWYKVVENVEVIDIAAEGKAIAKIDNYVIFLPFVIPGDIVNVQVVRKRKNYLEGRVIQIVKYSDKRATPFCEHFGVCGGCKWQNLPYEEQLKYKQKQGIDQLERIGKIKIDKIEEIVPSLNTIKYRNKLEYTFSNKRWLYDGEVELINEKDYWGCGFHVPGRFDKVIDVDICYLQIEPTNKIRKEISLYCKNHNLPFYDLRLQNGFIRNLIVRTTNKGELMVILTFFENNLTEIIKLLQFVETKFKEINSLYYAINPKSNDSLDGINPILYSGKEQIIERLGDLDFIISPKSFFQTNSYQAEQLYYKVLEFCNLNESKVLYDIYCGTGTIGLFASKQCAKVVGIEYVEDAVVDARKNAELNNIANSSFYAGDVKDILTESFVKSNGNPDIVIVDPPRAGIHKTVVETIIKIRPEVIVYVSCNPATQARDLQIFSDYYNVVNCQPFDMFPHTHHVENIVKLLRK